MSRLVAAVAVLALLTGCSTSKDAVETGQDFTFVAPGGQTTSLYDPPESRGTLRALSGESLLQPGTTTGLETFPGRVVVLNIWGSWCGPCRAEAPDLEFVAQQTGADGVSVLGVDVRDDRAAATDFVRDRGITYDSVFDPPARTLVSLSTRGAESAVTVTDALPAAMVPNFTSSGKRALVSTCTASIVTA